MPSDASIRSLAESFMSKEAATSNVDAVTFIESSWGLNFKLFPVQRFCIKLYYSLPLDNTDRTIVVPDMFAEREVGRFTEREFLTWLHKEKRCNLAEPPTKPLTELILIWGRKSGKSTISPCIPNYEAYKLLKMGDPAVACGLRPDSKISTTNVAPTDGQSKEVFDIMMSMAQNCVFFKDRIKSPTQSSFSIKTDSDTKRYGHASNHASITMLSGGCSSNSIRGPNCIVVLMDEVAYFIDNDGRFSGSKVYNALRPSIAAMGNKGKIISISSPASKSGILWDRYTQSFNETSNTLMLKMYTAMVSPLVDSSLLRGEYNRDPRSFMCEYGGEFSDQIAGWVEDEKKLLACVTSRPPSSRGITGVQYYMGIDLGVKNDGTAIAIVHREGRKIVLDYAVVWYGAKSDVWKHPGSIYRHCAKYKNNEFIRIADILREIKELHEWFPVRDGLFDQYNGQALNELFVESGMRQFHMDNLGDMANSDMFKLVKSLYMEEMLDLYDHDVLVPELISLEANMRTANKIIVAAPERDGAHDDISDAFVRAVFACHQGTMNSKTGGSSRHESLALLGQPERPEDKVVSLKQFQCLRAKAHGFGARANLIRRAMHRT